MEYLSIYQAQPLSVPISDLTTLQYNTILAGIVYGFVDNENCVEIETCIGDGSDEAKLAYDAFQLIASADRSDNIAGFTELAQVVAALPGMMTDCKNTKEDQAILEAWALNLYSQTDLEGYIRHNVKRHIIALTADVAKAKALYAAEKYWAFGMLLGDMATIATQ